MRAASSARLSEPMMPVIAVTTRKNGNIDISAESAIWLAIDQPSAAGNSQKASRAYRKLRRRKDKARAIPLGLVDIANRGGLGKPEDARRGLRPPPPAGPWPFRCRAPGGREKRRDRGRAE